MLYEVITILEEKVEIARQYLIPKALEQHGLQKSQVTIRKDALRAISYNFV